ncbi:MAG: GMC oxidoreductase, partial [Ginsengibacter sp.]
PKQIHLDQGRSQCQNRSLCQRGCPVGGYFNSNATTIPWAQKTGNMTLRPFSVVHSIIYDDQKNKAVGVRVIDANTKESIEYYASVIFVNAGAFNTNLILLNSTSKRFPNGFGNDNGLLGKYAAFHNYRARITAKCDGFKDSTTEGGRRPTSAYIPRFRNLHKQETDFLRGYASTFHAGRGTIQHTDGLGENLKSALMAKAELGPWNVGSQMMGETIPKETNYLALDENKKDDWGVPLLKISIDYDDNEEKMIKDFFEQMTEMFTKAGFTDINTSDSKQAPGLDIHHMGGVRMGKDPKTSLLNKWHQFHNCSNVFVTDGACMTSTSTQNPSLTFMAFTARTVDYAVSQLKKGEI